MRRAQWLIKDLRKAQVVKKKKITNKTIINVSSTRQAEARSGNGAVRVKRKGGSPQTLLCREGVLPFGTTIGVENFGKGVRYTFN